MAMTAKSSEYGPQPGDLIAETLEQQIRRKGIQPVRDISDYAIPGLWSDEELDAFLAFVRASRRGEV
jgi:hypothetical protein